LGNKFTIFLCLLPLKMKLPLEQIRFLTPYR